MPLARRRRRLLVGSTALLTVGFLATGASSPAEPAHARIALYSDGVALDADGVPRLVEVGADVVDDPVQRARQDAWLAAGRVPGPERYRDMAEQALRDLDALVLDDGAALAAGSPYWRYVWPRDASFTAAALARTGHADDAHRVLTYLARMHERSTVDGVLQARYLPDGSGGTPDARAPQLDGNGWVLWGVAQWYAAAGPGRDAQLEELRGLVTGSLATIRAHVDPVTGLPPAFPDYWEVRESRPTLGTAAPLLAGARAAGPVLAALGEPPVGDLVALLERGVEGNFAPHYPRRLGGRAQDTAVAWLMPPFGAADDQVTSAWRDAAAGMARPAGGLAPGEDWKNDGVSWTPETAMWALTAAASGEVELAEDRLDWLDRHRTDRGSLPEKVLHDGSPAAVAPLAWTASTVLLALDELDRQGAGSGP
ncbi:glycoside hydrolase family 15 [Actinotalea sp. Marseille-Q4924]|uniref:glycoside hydrolase family 15 n=1 Tax=Actinotalea sp. Marseille-Q4924 TaxID=2866571 RepID=UPI001CE3D302|nr:glycoside hydrolase family 15 [Actinotalea sp. Marseille-Q4924]